jgi:uncharacterized protein HemX
MAYMTEKGKVVEKLTKENYENSSNSGNSGGALKVLLVLLLLGLLAGGGYLLYKRQQEQNQ